MMRECVCAPRAPPRARAPSRGYALDLWQVPEALLERAQVVRARPLARQLAPQRRRGLRLPQPHIHVVRARRTYLVRGRGQRGVRGGTGGRGREGCALGVAREARREDALHALRVVHLAALARVRAPDAQRAVVRARHELFARRRVVDVCVRGGQCVCVGGGGALACCMP